MTSLFSKSKQFNSITIYKIRVYHEHCFCQFPLQLTNTPVPLITASKLFISVAIHKIALALTIFFLRSHFDAVDLTLIHSLYIHPSKNTKPSRYSFRLFLISTHIFYCIYFMLKKYFSIDSTWSYIE